MILKNLDFFKISKFSKLFCFFKISKFQNFKIFGGSSICPKGSSSSIVGRLVVAFKIIFQDFGKIILKNNIETKSRLFFKILAKIFLNKIIDFTIYLYGGAKRSLITRS